MKIWIRSQERDRLEVCESISIQPLITSNKKHTSWCIVANFGRVGEYDTRERCLEIIDEIQKLLYCDFATVNSNTTIKDLEKTIKQKGSILHFPKEPLVEYHSASTVVYEMPNN